MKQILDTILQIVTLIMGCVCFVLATFEDDPVIYTATAMALVCVSILFGRLNDKEERK